jgi:hypothetical protein
MMSGQGHPHLTDEDVCLVADPDHAEAVHRRAQSRSARDACAFAHGWPRWNLATGW